MHVLCQRLARTWEKTLMEKSQGKLHRRVNLFLIISELRSKCHLKDVKVGSSKEQYQVEQYQAMRTIPNSMCCDPIMWIRYSNLGQLWTLTPVGNSNAMKAMLDASNLLMCLMLFALESPLVKSGLSLFCEDIEWRLCGQFWHKRDGGP